METRFQTIGIVGMGLIGASFARALKARSTCRVYADNRTRATLTRAMDEGVIDAALDETTIPQADMILIALYPAAAIAWVEEHVHLIDAHTVVIDCCGVKRAVSPDLSRIAAENGFTYVGGHPMAGRELSGYDAALETLYNGASMILTNTPEDLIEPLQSFFLGLGFGRVQLSTPEEHDHIIAYTSQLAHVLSSAYVKSPTALTHTGFSAGSFQDMTRVAYLNETMWTELFLDNSEYLADEVDSLCQRLQLYADAIRERRREDLFALLKEGRERKEFVEGLHKK